MSLNLYQHQIDNARWLAATLLTNGAALDTSDPGTGKTYTALAVAAALGRPIAVVSPLAVGPGWAHKAKECGVPLEWINYERAREKAWVPAEPRALVVFDEAHRCKAPDSKQAKLLARVSSTYPTLMLTGTPFTSPLETRAMLTALRRTRWDQWYSLLPDLGCFRNKALHNAWMWRRKEADIYALRKMIEPFTVRTDWTSVSGFIGLQLTADVVPVEEPDKVDAALREIATRASNDLTATLKEREYVEGAKVAAVSDIAADLLDAGRSVVVFFNFTKPLREFADLMDCSWIDGSVSGANRERNLREFQESTTPRCLACNIQAAGEGVDMHDTVGIPRVALHMPTWSAQSFKQCVFRTHRLGAKSAAQHRVLFAAGTRDEAVLDKVRSKLDSLNSLTDSDLTIPA